jgi:ABC-type lipoprotein export system ATPase subunit
VLSSISQSGLIEPSAPAFKPSGTQRRLTFIMVTHDSAIAKKAPRLATIRKGKITVRENAAT